MAYVARRTLRHARVLRRRLTSAETILWSRLRRDSQGIRFRRQQPIGSFIADFACIPARLVVEIDGATHGSDVTRSYDARRDGIMRSQGWRILRFSNADVYESLDGMMEFIVEVAAMRTRKHGSALNR